MKTHEKPDTEDHTPNLWRVGFLESWSEVFQEWIRHNEPVTIRPTDRISVLEREWSREWKCRIRLYVPLF